MRIGANCWNQWTSWPDLLEAGLRVDRLGYDTLWTWDHLYPIVGEGARAELRGLAHDHRLGGPHRARADRPDGRRQPAARARAGGEVATTLDHISRRAGDPRDRRWPGTRRRRLDFGIDFGSGVGERLRWLGEALPILRGMLDGSEPTAAGPRYHSQHTRNLPPPLQERLPIFLGGGGEKVTLRLAAQHADLCNFGGDVETVRRKEEVLLAHCEAVGRDPATIERTLSVGTVFLRDDRAAAEAAGRVAFERNRAEPWKPHYGRPEEVAEELARSSSSATAT